MTPPVMSSAVETPRWHFSDPALCEQFREICRAWGPTPFAEHSRAKGPGGGIDCAGFLEETFFEAGFPRFNFPRSDADYKGHAHNDKILRFLRGQYRLPPALDSAPGSGELDPQSALLASLFAELTDFDQLVPIVSWPQRPVTLLMTGDILVIKAKIPGVWHLPVMQDDRTFAQCAYPLGVTAGDITQADYRSRLRAVFRARALNL